VVQNAIRAHAVGAVTGVYVPHRFARRKLQHYLLTTDFERKIVPHAKTLKKLEVGQLNAVLNAYTEEISRNAQ
jgi:hypothetical protein